MNDDITLLCAIHGDSVHDEACTLYLDFYNREEEFDNGWEFENLWQFVSGNEARLLRLINRFLFIGSTELIDLIKAALEDFPCPFWARANEPDDEYYGMKGKQNWLKEGF